MSSHKAGDLIIRTVLWAAIAANVLGVFAGPPWWSVVSALVALGCAVVLVLQPHEGNFWDEWRGQNEDNGDAGRPVIVFWLKRLVYLPVWYRAGKWLGCRIDLHKFTGADQPGCYHTHPAWAIRIILWGGYWEEVHYTDTLDRTEVYLEVWRPGQVGVVRPEFAHRIEKLCNGRSSWSLWLRGPIVAPITLVGDGWPKDAKPMRTAGIK